MVFAGILNQRLTFSSRAFIARRCLRRGLALALACAPRRAERERGARSPRREGGTVFGSLPCLPHGHTVRGPCPLDRGVYNSLCATTASTRSFGPGMFTGIITDLGCVRDVRNDGDTRIEITSRCDDDSIPIGASIACSGVCLTVIDKGPGWFGVQVSAETLSRTTLGNWRPGTRVNLERALRLGDELGGHLVSGHVDGVGRVAAIAPEGASRRSVFEAPAQLARFIASKGSVSIDGISLTVNEVDGARFGVNIIPHTLSVTTLGEAGPGDRVNLEIDLLARYVARLIDPG